MAEPVYVKVDSNTRTPEQKAFLEYYGHLITPVKYHPRVHAIRNAAISRVMFDIWSEKAKEK